MAFEHTLPTNLRPAGDICVPLFIPDDPHYVALLVKAVRMLELDNHYVRDAGKSALVVREQWRKRTVTPLIEALSKGIHCGGCREWPPYHQNIEWFPNNPYTETDLVTDGYLFPAWYVAGDIAAATFNAVKGAVVTSIERLPSGSLPALIPASGLPRFRINVTGTGIVKIHINSINAGGLLQVTVDDDPLTAEWVDTNIDVIAIPPETEQITIIEREFTTAGEHWIDCIIVPSLDDALVPLLYGGGLVKVEACGFEEQYQGKGDDLAGLKMRLNSQCEMEFSTDDGSSWSVVEDWVQNAAACFLGDTGASGANGADGIDGDDGINGIDGQTSNEYPAPPTAASDPDGLCGAVYEIANELNSYIQQSIIDEQTFTLDDFLSALLVSGGFIGGLLTTFWDFFVANANPNLGAEVSSAIDAVAEHFYCAELDRTIAIAAIDADATITTDAQAAYIGAINSITDGKMALWAFVGSQDTTQDCSLFCGWCVTHDWTGSNANGWVVGTQQQSAGVLGANGWDSEDIQPVGLSGQRIVNIDRTFTSSLVTGIHLNCNYTRGSFDQNRRALQFITEDTGVRTDVYILMSSSIPSGSPINFEWNDPAGQQMDLIRIFLRSSADATSPYSYSGVAQLHNIVICGDAPIPGDL